MQNFTSLNNDIDDLKSTFVRNVGHELRMPVTIIQGYAELLREGELGPLDPEQEKAIGNIANWTKELRRLVERVNLLLALRSNPIELKEDVNLNSIAQAAFQAYTDKAAAANIQFSFQPQPNLPPVLGDPYQLQMAIECLLENGLKFTQADGAVTLSLHHTPEHLVLAISDNGIGIPLEQQETLFTTSFYQLDGSTTRRYGGLGLGLTLVREVIQRHQGQLSLQSQTNQGTTFTIKLPVKGSAMQAQPLQPIKNRRILIVDDEEYVTLTLEAGLQRMPNCEITTTNSVREAMALLDEQDFDLLITDYQMPEADGLTLATHVQAHHPHTATIMITAYKNDVLASDTGTILKRIIDKPVRLRDIRQITSDILAEQSTNQH